MRDGPSEGLARLDAAAAELPDSHLVAATRADLYRRLGHDQEAARHYRIAVEQARNDGERRYLRRRLTEVTKIN
jgi:RNA polymerase sigma-70 factor (ECF subfamily)